MRFNPYILEKLRLRTDEAEAMVRDTGMYPDYASNRLDASDALFSARELQSIKKVLYYEKFPEFMADELCPVSSDNHTGSKQVGYEIMTPTGKAKVVDDDSNDVPIAEIKKLQTFQPVVTIKMAIRWNIQDLREAMLAQMSKLSSSYSFTEEKTRSVLFAIKSKEEDIFLQGDAAYDVPGFCNNSNISAVTLTNSDAWNGRTAEQIVATLNELLNNISSSSKGVFQANVLLLPTKPFDLLASKPFSGTNGTATETILSFFHRTKREIIPNFKIVKYPRLDELTASSQYTIIAYKLDPMILSMEIPQPMETFGPVTNDSGQTFQTTVRMRIAGVQLRYPIACNSAKITTW